MNIEININDYLDKEDVAEICRNEVKNGVRSMLAKENDLHRFLENSSYRFVWAAVEELCPDNMMDMITAKIPEIVNGLTAFSVFREKDTWRCGSKGQELLEQAIVNAEPQIKERVQQLIGQIDLYMIRDILTEQIDNAIENLKSKITNEGAPS